MPVRPNNPNKIGTKAWYEYNSPGIFSASKKQTTPQFKSQQALRQQGGQNKASYNPTSGYVPYLPDDGTVQWMKDDKSSYNIPGGAGAYAASNNSGGGGGGGGRGGGGGGGGGAPAIDTAALMNLMNRGPQSYTWKDLAFQDYVPSEYRAFDTGKWDTLRSGLTDAITADRSAGNAQYEQLGQEMAAYQNPWSTPSATQNPQQSAAMQRMMQANNTATNINQSDTNQGVQADQAFGNLGTMLGMVAQQDQASRLRSNQGYQRNLNERLDAEQRGGMLNVNMSQAQAQELYEKEKWEFGESIAQMNYKARTENAQYNNTGQNQTGQGNAQLANEWNQANYKQLMDLIASGVKIDPAALQTYTAGA